MVTVASARPDWRRAAAVFLAAAASGDASVELVGAKTTTAAATSAATTTAAAAAAPPTASRRRCRRGERCTGSGPATSGGAVSGSVMDRISSSRAWAAGSRGETSSSGMSGRVRRSSSITSCGSAIAHLPQGPVLTVGMSGTPGTFRDLCRQAPAGPVQAHPGGAGAAAEDLAGLGRAEAVPGDEAEDLPVLVVDGAERLTHLAHVVAGLLGRRAVRGQRQPPEQRGVPLLAALVVQPDVAGDGQQPGCRVVVGHVVQPPPGHEERLGDDVVGPTPG